MADYHTVYKDVEGTTTEWHDIQAKLGNFAPKEKPQNTTWQPKEEKESKKDGEEDNWDENEDDDFMEEYRKKRIQELKTVAMQPRFSSMELIKSADFVREVTNASQNCWVICLLFKDGHSGSELLMRSLNELAQKSRSTKFVKIISTDCIPNYPDSQLPTVLVYKGGQIKEKFVGLKEFTLGGFTKLTAESVALALCKVGPVLADPDETEEDVLERVRRDVIAGWVGDNGGEKDE